MPELDPDQVRIAVEAVIGTPDSVTGGEANYPCPLCEKHGYSTPSHLHIAWAKPAMICHQCLSGARSLIGIVLAVFGHVPTGLNQRFSEDVPLQDHVRNLMAPKSKMVKEDRAAVELPEGFQPFCRKPRNRLERVVLDYLTEQRGVPWSHLRAISAGYCTSGKLRGYAVFPVIVNGELVTYTSRRVTALHSKVRHAYNADSNRAVFNYDEVKSARRVFVGEGPFDAFALHRRVRDTDGGVATMGTILHDAQARLLADLPAEEIVIWYDEDAHAKAHKAADLLHKIAGSKRISTITVNDKDPDELSDETLRRYVKGRAHFNPLTSGLRAMLA